MNRQECEKKILEKLEEIVAIYHEYNQEGDYLYLSYMKDDDGVDKISFNNSYWEDDKENPIRVNFGVSWPC